jgi:hypothetical protein
MLLGKRDAIRYSQFLLPLGSTIVFYFCFVVRRFRERKNLESD